MLGQMLDLSAIVSTAEVVFPSGVFSRTATNDGDGQWTIT